MLRGYRIVNSSNATEKFHYSKCEFHQSISGNNDVISNRLEHFYFCID